MAVTVRSVFPPPLDNALVAPTIPGTPGTITPLIVTRLSPAHLSSPGDDPPPTISPGPTPPPGARSLGPQAVFLLPLAVLALMIRRRGRSGRNGAAAPPLRP